MSNKDYLLSCINSLSDCRVKVICQAVVNDERFQIAPGGSEHHHNYKHGLIQHVREVMRNAEQLSYGRPSDVLITSIIFHDYMKTRDYSIAEDGSVIKKQYRKLINHVSGSFGEFYYQAKTQGLLEEFIDEVSHCLLSHHGRREWGSPVEPLTADAFILHTADMMSSRGIVL